MAALEIRTEHDPRTSELRSSPKVIFLGRFAGATALLICVKRRAFEMSLDKVESVDVHQSILGRLMNYGDIPIQGVGEGTQTISTVASPLAFRNAITAQPVGT